jgi:hypothetical protein
LYRSDSRLRDVTILCFILVVVITDELQHHAKVFHIKKEHSAIIGYLKDKIQYSGLCIVEIQKPREKQRTHIAYRRTNRMTLLAMDIPKRDGEALEVVTFDAQLFEPPVYFRITASGL